MKLVGYGGKAKRVRVSAARTTIPGEVNGNGQEVVEKTWMASKRFPGQVVYRMKCQRCGAEYGSNGMVVKDRRCPKCQGGAEGEPVPEVERGLFG